MEENNDKPMDLKKEVEEHKQGDQEMREKEEIQSHELIARSSNSNPTTNIGVKKEKRQFKKIDLLYFFILILCMAVLIGTFMFMKSETAQCIKNPYLYGASKMGNVECSCTQQIGSVCPPRFSFNDTFFDASVTRCSSGETNVYPQFKDLNISFIVTTP